MANNIIYTTKSQFSESCLYLNGQPFSLNDYPHMREIYDCSSKEIVMMFSRQTSKCLLSEAKQRLANGSVKLVKDLVPGDILLAFNEENHSIVLNKIKDVSDNGLQPIYKIITKTGCVANVTAEHPFWVSCSNWVEAKDLHIGDCVGVSADNSASLILSNYINLFYPLYKHIPVKNHLPSFVWKLNSLDLFDYLKYWIDKKSNVLSTEHGTVVNFMFASETLIDDLRELFLRAGVTAIKRAFKSEKHKIIYELEISDTNSIKQICKYIKSSKIKFNKLKLCYFSSNSILYDPIVAIEILPAKPTTSIEMEAPNHTFLINNIITHNSTTMANLMLTDALMTPYLKIMYVSPTVKQTKVFSNDRVSPVIASSPIIQQYYIDGTVVQNVFTKAFVNHSKLFLQYALLNADKLRGISSDKIMFDEVQDLKEEVIPIIQESTSRSMRKEYVFAGTPKRSKGTLAKYWHSSSQNEYLIKCSHCNHWNLLDDTNIGPYGLICSKCTKPLKLTNAKAEWVSTYSLTSKPKREGFRVCALHFAEAPWVDWNLDILQKREIYSTAAFFNEVLGMEYDAGVSPISEMELQACCDPEVELHLEPNNLEKSYDCIMGIDYGPVNSEHSFTTISVVQRRMDKYYVVYMKKFLGKEAEYSFIHREVPRLMKVWNCSHLAADYGMGEAPNSEFRRRLGDQRVVAFLHNPSQKERIHWNNQMPAYTLNRTQNMLGLFNGFKRRLVILPRWEDTKPFADDILNIQAEYNEELGTMTYNNVAGPDDFFHATLYALTAMELLKKESLLMPITPVAT